MKWTLRILGVILLAAAAICFSYANHEYEFALGAEREAQKAPNNPVWTATFLKSAELYRQEAQYGLFAGIGGVVLSGGLIVLSFVVKRSSKSA